MCADILIEMENVIVEMNVHTFIWNKVGLCAEYTSLPIKSCCDLDLDCMYRA